MSIVGKLYVDGKAFNMLSYSMRFYQSKDIAGQPRGRVNGGLIELKIEAHRDHIFHHWAVAPEMMKDVEIVFSPVTRISQSRTIKLYDVYLARIATCFDNYSVRPMSYTLVLSPGILVDGHVIFKKPWHITDLESVQSANTDQETTTEQLSFDIDPEIE